MACHAAEVLELTQVRVDGLVAAFKDREPARLVAARERFDADDRATPLDGVAASR
jgi:hypothetical protein